MSTSDQAASTPSQSSSTPKATISQEPETGKSKANGSQASGPKPAPPAAKPVSEGAAKKLAAKAEKAARRAQEVAARQAGAAATSVSAGPSRQDTAAATKQPAKGGKEAGKAQQKPRTGSMVGDRNVAIRGGKPAPQEPAEPPKEDKTVELFRHLYKTRTVTIAGVHKEVHPAVLALGQQISSYVICGSNARLVSMLQVFKRVIESYTTPRENSFSRHFTPHVLSPQIEYLASCRPLSVSMGTAIRWLKLKISKLDPDTTDPDAKRELCEDIDEYIQHRVILADQVIAQSVSEKIIKDGDVILTYAKSSIVQQSIIKAHLRGTKFRVIVVDSRPLFEGKALARALVGLGIETKYCLMSGLVHCIRDATKVLLGAHAMMSNGRLFSRVGAAQVAMEAHDIQIPVIVLCESIKCTEKVALDSIVLNEVAPPDELLMPSKTAGQKGILAGWRDTKHLQLLNLMYDVTPADYLAMIVTELGIVPPSSVPVLQRLANEGQ